MTRAAHPWVKLAVLFAVLAVMIWLPHALGIHWSQLSPDRIRSLLLSFGSWSPVAFLVAYGQPLVPLPASIVLMAAGLAFGMGGGIAISLVAMTIRGCGQFLIARLLGREAVERMLRGRLADVDAWVGTRGLQAVLWVRVIPNVPYDLQSFGLGLSRIPFATFAVGTLLGGVPSTTLWVYLGHSLTQGSVLWKIIIALAGLLLLVFVPRWVRARAVSGRTSA